MNINSNLGQEIIKRIEEYIAVDINIMDLTGKIVASTDENRINQIHSGAIEVIKTNKELILHKDDVIKYKGTKPGANLPIIHNNKIEGVVGVSGNPDEILPMTGLIRVSVEIIIDQLYNQRQEYYEERQWSYWLQQLLHPAGLNEESLKSEAEYTLNTNMDGEWKVIVISGEFVQDYLELYRQYLSEKSVLFTLPFLSDEVVIVIPSNFNNISKLLDDLLKMSYKYIKIGVGEVSYGMKGIRDSYFQAKQAISFETETGVISHSKDWKLERLAHAVTDEVYNQICAQFENDLLQLDSIYLDTLNVYFDMNFSVKQTASILHIHRNTLLYRLEQIYKKVGLDPRLFLNAFILKLIISKNM